MRQRLVTARLASMAQRSLLVALAVFGLASRNRAADSPSQSATAAETGSVVMRMVIGTDGVPFHPVVIKGLTPEEERNSLEAVRQWRFRPAMKNGKPIPRVAMVAINFGPREDTGAPQVRQESVTHIPTADEDRALLEWYVNRAEAGDTGSQVEAAIRLSSKNGVDDDLVQACAWATIAARNGSKDAFKLRAKLAKRMTAPQVDEADRTANDWKPGTSLSPR